MRKLGRANLLAITDVSKVKEFFKKKRKAADTTYTTEIQDE
jgi:hypothetical protein